MALLKDAKQAEAAKRFLRYVESNEASRVFAKFGFILEK
jgi:ABC-type molybdate transport system substrate-binding protein